ncbi:FG-GAP-like repeat-containing protein, partial [Patescibacteria group bacterium]
QILVDSKGRITNVSTIDISGTYESPLTFTNGLTRTTNDVHLGGTLSEATTITQGAFDTIFDLTGIGDFRVQDNGTDVFYIEDSGTIGIGTTNPTDAYDIDVSGTLNTDTLYISDQEVLASGSELSLLDGATITLTELNLLDGRLNTLVDSVNIGSYATTGVTAGSGLTGGAGSGPATLHLAGGAGLTITDDGVTIDATTTGTTSISSSNSGIEVTAGGLRLLGGCSDNQVLQWNSTSSTWTCDTVTSGTASGDITTVTAGSGLSGGGTEGAVTLNITGGDGIFVTEDSISIDTTTTGTTSITSSNSGLEITAGGLRLLGGCADEQVLEWNSAGATWGCRTVTSGTAGVSGDITQVGSMTTGAAFAGAGATGDWLGLGASAGRIEFWDDTTDTIAFSTANVGIGTTDPSETLHVEGDILGTGHFALGNLPSGANSNIVLDIEEEFTSSATSYGLSVDTEFNYSSTGHNYPSGISNIVDIQSYQDNEYTTYIDGISTSVNLYSSKVDRLYGIDNQVNMVSGTAAIVYGDYTWLSFDFGNSNIVTGGVYANYSGISMDSDTKLSGNIYGDYNSFSITSSSLASSSDIYGDVQLITYEPDLSSAPADWVGGYWNTLTIGEQAIVDDAVNYESYTKVDDYANVTTAYGLLNKINVYDFANIDTAYGAYSEIYRSAGSDASIDIAYNYYGTCDDATTCYGLYLDTADDTPTTNYGIYLTAGSASANSYGIWGESGDWVLAEDGDGTPGGTGAGGELYLGDGQDLELYHDGTNSQIVNNTGQLFIGDASTDDVILSYNGGNVGIGTSDPSYRLDVSGSTNTASLFIAGQEVLSSGSELSLLDGATITVAELNLLDGRLNTLVDSVNVGSYATTGVTAGSGLTGGAGSGPATLNIAGGNAITVTENGLTIDATTTGTTSVSSGNSGIEVTAGGVRLLGGCADNQILQWDLSAEVWICEDAGTGSGDITAVGSESTGAAFADSSASGEWLGLGSTNGRIEFWNDTTDVIAFSTANVGIGTTSPSYLLDVEGSLNMNTLYVDGAQVLASGSELSLLDGATITVAELNLLDGVGGTIVSASNVDTYATVGVTAGSGLTGGGTNGLLTINLAGGLGLTVSENGLDLDVTTTGTTSVASANSGLELTAGGLRLIGGCSNSQVLQWDSSSATWMCKNATGGSETLQSAYQGGSAVMLSSTYGSIRFYNDGGDEILFLEEDTGYVGIGTTGPTSQLSVAGTNSVISNSSGLLTITPNTHLILSQGFMGIGTTGPTAYLDIIASTTSAASLHMGTGVTPISPNEGDFYSSGSAAYFYNGSAWKDITTQGSTYTAGNGLTLSGTQFLLSGTYTQNTLFDQAAFDTIYNLTSTGDFSIQDNGTDVFYVSDSGNVGIGTSNPDEFKLQLAGNIGPETNNTYDFGGITNMDTMDRDAGSHPDASFFAPNDTYGDKSGGALAILDFNGDGFDDLVIGGRDGNDTDDGLAPGEVWLILGTAPGTWSMDTDIEDQYAASWYGETTLDDFGEEVVSAGDVNGDGYEDILASDPAYNGSTGKAYLIFGAASGWTKNTDMAAGDDASWYAEGANESFAEKRSMVGGGDVNGDGFDDILIAAPDNAGGGTSRGQVYLILGKETGWSTDVDIATVADASWVGEGDNDDLGDALSFAGDINGDGYDDILIGAPIDDISLNEGQLYIVFGSPDAADWNMDVDIGTVADASFWGSTTSENLGYTLGGAGDVNGDGFDDFLAVEDAGGGTANGETYLVLGGVTVESDWSMDMTITDVAAASFEGEAALDYTGRRLAFGDVNKDGYSDFIIGSMENSETGTDTGQVYLILGKASGWAMDTDLGTGSDASWRGEAVSDDWLGTALAIGDLNGDGFGDIAMGASGNDEGGDAGDGQTYIIFASEQQFDSVLARNINASELMSIGKTSIYYDKLTTNGSFDINTDTLSINGKMELGGDFVIDTDKLVFDQSDGYLGLGTSSPLAQLNIKGSTSSVLSDGFEDNTLPPFSSSGDSIWYTTSGTAYTGTYSVTSGSVPAGWDYTSLTITKTVGSKGGQITFNTKVSSEEDWDFFKFIVDDVELEKWSGDTGWVNAGPYILTSGSHSFEWKYEKDGATAVGTDNVWVDDISIDNYSQYAGIFENGFVGIGTTTPQYALDVNGSLNISGGNTIKFSGTDVMRWDDTYKTIYLGEGAGQSERVNSLESVLIGYKSGYGAYNDQAVMIGYMAGFSYPSYDDNVTLLGYKAAYEGGGDEVTAIGYKAAYQGGGDEVTAIGYEAAFQNDATNGLYLTAVGAYAGYSNYGFEVTAIGQRAGYKNYGDDLTAVGVWAGYGNSAPNSVVVGNYTGFNNLGSYLTAVGYGAGWKNTGESSIFIGNMAGYSNPVDYLFELKQNNVNTTPLLQGYFDTGYLGVATTDPTHTLEVGGDIYIHDDLYIDEGTSFLLTNGTDTFFEVNDDKDVLLGASTNYLLSKATLTNTRSTGFGNPVGRYWVSESSEYVYAYSIGVSDFDKDGDEDIATANRGYQTNGTVTVLMNEGDGTYGTATSYASGSDPRDINVGDLNNDGYDDLVSANRYDNTVSVYINDGDGTFASQVNYNSGSDPRSVSIGDVDHDGYKDLVVANEDSNNISVFINDGDGTFDGGKTDYTTDTSPEGVELGDLNNDGYLDVAVATWDNNTVSVLLNSGSEGTFDAKNDYTVDTGPDMVAIDDFDNDGYNDLATANYTGASMSILINDGDGTFDGGKVDYSVGSTSLQPYDIDVGDLNGDGYPDAAIPNDGSSTISVFINDGDGTFASSVEYTTSIHPEGVVIKDVDHDGSNDLAIANYSRGVTILLNDGDGTFDGAKDEYSTGDSPYGVAIEDLDKDGYKDLATANYGDDTISIFINDEDGTFASKSDYSAGNTPIDVDAGDFDNDGYTDIVAVNYAENTASIFLNSGPGLFPTRSTYTTGSNPYYIKVGDLNNDGYKDIATANWSGGTTSVLLNSGSAGVFNTKTDYTVGTNPITLDVGDLDNDGYNDLAVSNRASNSVSVLLNSGSEGTFDSKVDYTSGSSPTTVVIGDVDLDGYKDLVTSNYGAGTVSVFINDGDGTFADKVDYTVDKKWLWGASLGDFNNDGYDDITVTSSYTNGVYVLINDGDGTFNTTIQHYKSSAWVGDIATGDLNNDGFPDMATPSSYHHIMSVFINGANANKVQGDLFVSGNIATLSKVGIGTYDPDYELEVVGDAYIYDDLYVGSTTEAITNASFTMDGDDMYVQDLLGVADTIYTENEVVVGSGTLTLGTDYITASKLLNINALQTDTRTYGFGTPIESYSAGTDPLSTYVEDLNNDGYKDIVTTNASSNSISIYINDGDGTYASQVQYNTETYPRSVSVGDLDNDGWEDIAVANRDSNLVSVFINAGDGTFAADVTYTSGSSPYGISIKDLDNDGYNDISTANYGADTVSVLVNDGDGTFDGGKTDYSSGANPTSVSVGDVDNDGYNDIATSNWTDSTISIIPNDGDGTFDGGKTDYTAGSGPYSISIGELNNDGWRDIAVTLDDDSEVSVLLNDGDGTFDLGKTDYSTGYFPNSISIGDVDNDGYNDLAYSNGTSDSLAIHYNDGDGTFSGRTFYYTFEDPYSVFAEDIDNDGYKDLISTNDSNIVTIMRNEGDGTFSERAEYTSAICAYSIATRDLNNDGFPDLGVTESCDSKVGIFINDGDGTFAAKVQYSTGSVPSHLDMKDLDNDGYPDLVVPNANSTLVSVLINDGDGTFDGGKTDYTAGSAPSSAVVADFNKDGWNDIAATLKDDNEVTILLNDGDGTFDGGKTDYTVQTSPYRVDSGDFNNDGYPDLAVANYISSSISVLINSGSAGVFDSAVNYTSGSPYSVDIGDLNNDGYDDIVSSYRSGDAISVLINDGDGTFATRVYYYGVFDTYGVEISDFNNDGHNDIACTGGDSNYFSVFINDGDGTFDFTRLDYSNGRRSQAIVAEDFDKDGYSDLATSNYNSGDMYVFLNGSNSNKMHGDLLVQGNLLDVRGNARIRSIGSGAYSTAVNQTSDGTLTTATSDIRMKTDIETIDNALDKVLQLRGVTFNWLDPNEPKRMTGMIAQEVIDIMPELVFQNPTDGYYGINYGQTAGLLIEAIKEQQGQIDDLKTSILAEIAGSEALESTSSSSVPDEDMLTQMQGLFDEFVEFASTLAMTSEGGGGDQSLVIDSDVNILGDVTLANLNITGNIQAGMVEVDTVENSINVLGSSCYNPETDTLNEGLCETQALYLQKESSGNLNVFDGKLVIKPDGTMELDGSLEVTGTVKAQDVETSQITIEAQEETSKTAGKIVVPAGETTTQVFTTAVDENSIIMVTPERPVAVGSRFVELGTFEVTLVRPEPQDLPISWFILGNVPLPSSTEASQDVDGVSW